MKQPSTCALQNFFGNGPYAHVYKPLDPNAWPKTRNVPTHLNYPFYKKANGRWDELLKPHYYLPQTFLFRDLDIFIASF